VLPSIECADTCSFGMKRGWVMHTHRLNEVARRDVKTSQPASPVRESPSGCGARRSVRWIPTACDVRHGIERTGTQSLGTRRSDRSHKSSDFGIQHDAGGRTPTESEIATRTPRLRVTAAHCLPKLPSPSVTSGSTPISLAPSTTGGFPQSSAEHASAEDSRFRSGSVEPFVEERVQEGDSTIPNLTLGGI
jgi:hypothetical protein